MVKLICVTANNNNKYYYMTDLNNGTFKVQYGRIGGGETVISYPISQWDKKYNDKIKKGYIDVTEKSNAPTSSQELDITDNEVKDLISFLMKCAKQSVRKDYAIAAESITNEQIELVQQLIDDINNMILPSMNTLDPNSNQTYSITNVDHNKINEILKDVYSIIPRKMEDTRRYFLHKFDLQFIMELLQKEQQRLDTLKSQVTISQTKSSITLNTLGFTCELASEEDKELIREKTDFRLKNHKVFKISNPATEAVFNPKGLQTKLLYHGSRNENFLSILQTGLKIRPKGVATTGSMFGNGIYAANKARKSIGYTSLRGSYWASGRSNKAYLAIFEFATGKEYEVLKNQTYSYWMGNLDKQKVEAQGCDSVFAQGGVDLRNDEYIVYDSNHCTIRYLIELTEEYYGNR